MITYVEGDLFTSPAHVLVNTVNTVGVMGKGIAKEFKAIYPEMFRIYQELCERGEFTIGKLLLYRTPHKWVLNFPTKRHWKQRSRVEDIEAGLKTFAASYAQHSLVSVAFPQLGCGNGELDWESQVRPLMEQYLGPLPIDIYIHIYADGSLLPEHRDRRRMHEWLRSEPRSLPFGEVWDDLVAITTRNGASDWQIVLDGEERPAALRRAVGAGEMDLPRDDLFDLWHQLRTFGFVSVADVPWDYAPLADALLDLFEQLPYVEAARFAPLTRNRALEETAALLDDAERGIRLVPPALESTIVVDVLTQAAIE